MQYKATLLLGLALVLGGMAAYMVKTAVNQPTGTPEGPAALAVKPVVVAAADLPSGTLLERAHLKVVDFTEASFQKEATPPLTNCWTPKHHQS